MWSLRSPGNRNFSPHSGQRILFSKWLFFKWLTNKDLKINSVVKKENLLWSIFVLQQLSLYPSGIIDKHWTQQAPEKGWLCMKCLFSCNLLLIWRPHIGQHTGSSIFGIRARWSRIWRRWELGFCSFFIQIMHRPRCIATSGSQGLTSSTLSWEILQKGWIYFKIFNT